MNPFVLFIGVVVSLIGAITLLIFAPGFLLVYGPLLAHGWSVLIAWMVVEYLDELYEREREARTRATAALTDTALYRVHWVSTATGYEGWGTGSFPLTLVERWCEDLNRSCPVLWHWPEKVTDSKERT